MSPWLLVHLAATWAMVGFIWTIQVLQYPMMAAVPADAFRHFEAGHQRRVSVVLGLFAPIEVLSAAAVFLAVEDVPRWLSFGAGATLAGIWISTGAFYGPLHGRLAGGFDPVLHRRLVGTNWWRTSAWTLRGIAAAAMVAIAA